MPLDKTMLRIGSDDWGSRLVHRTNGDLEVRCGGGAYGYAAAAPIPPSLDHSSLEIALTAKAGNPSIGLMASDGSFLKEVGAFPSGQKVKLPMQLAGASSLIVKNLGIPNSVIRIHDISTTPAPLRPEFGAASDEPSVANAAFWDEACGTGAAKRLGVTDNSPRSLKRFDDWYFGFYPWLFMHIPFVEMQGLDVLEVGLGYGTVAQRLAEWGARFTGLDIAAGPVNLVNHRLRQNGLSGEAKIGSILDAPFADESFDRVVSIGCLHHTGDMQRALNECWRILKPRGKLIFMVYNAFALRRWRQATATTAGLWLRERLGYRGVLSSETQNRKTWDANEAGDTAPIIDFASVTSLRHLCRRFQGFSCARELLEPEPPFFSRSRIDELSKTCWPRIAGLNIYATATKTHSWYHVGSRH
jgi:SAM-dependent methyltransferase